MGIYVDVLLAVNFMVDYLLLAAAKLLCRRQLCRGRMVLAALVGAVSSLAIFLPPMMDWAQWSLQILTAGIMVLLSEQWQGTKRFLTGWIMLFIVSFLFGGVMLALRLTAGEGWMLCGNGQLYFHIPPLVLVGNIALGFGAIQLFQRLFPEKSLAQCCSVELSILGRRLNCRAMVDTGNLLQEPFSGWPVVILEDSLFPGKIPQEKLRLIPCKTVSGTVLLQAVRGDWLKAGDFSAEQFYVAKSKEPIGGACQLLLSAALLNSK